jgi:hypothetical protein
LSQAWRRATLTVDDRRACTNAGDLDKSLDRLRTQDQSSAEFAVAALTRRETEVVELSLKTRNRREVQLSSVKPNKQGKQAVRSPRPLFGAARRSRASVI